MTKRVIKQYAKKIHKHILRPRVFWPLQSKGN